MRCEVRTRSGTPQVLVQSRTVPWGEALPNRLGITGVLGRPEMLGRVRGEFPQRWVRGDEPTFEGGAAAATAWSDHGTCQRE